MVEDDEGLCNLLAQVLRNHGYYVLAARNGAEALELAGRKAENLGLLLTDLVLPGLSGSALADRLRERWPDLRVLFMSGHPPEVQQRAGGYVEGGNFLQKPFTPDTMIRRVAELLGPAGGAAKV